MKNETLVICNFSQKSDRQKKTLEMRGIETLAFQMQSERSTTELHPLLIPIVVVIVPTTNEQNIH